MKNTIKAITLAAILLVSSTFTFAAERTRVSEPKGKGCDATQSEGIIVFGAKDGIIVFGITGIIVFGAADGIIVFGRGQQPAACSDRTGILVSDRTGILVSD